MTMNKYMHPRNIYRTPPDFKQMAIEFEAFRNISKMNISGTIQVNFKDEESLRVLTQCLLKKDFDLDVNFPENKLIPTLPLRLNYILWLEDIMTVIGARDVTGIDIGCGASCIYPILAAKKNGWTMIATELNKDSIKYAHDNLTKNALNGKITVLEGADEGNPFSAILNRDNREDSEIADFTMCNPPFFDDDPSTLDLNNLDIKNRTGKRPHPNNASTGSGSELATSGGEVQFVLKMIRSSVHLKNRIKVFTTMLGHKSSLSAVLAELKSLAITNVCMTEFCQGRTTRWGVAWTFRSEFLLRTVLSYGQHTEINRKILIFPIKENCGIEAAHRTLCKILETLEDVYVTTEHISESSAICCLVAYKNSWSKQRRKRRAEAVLKRSNSNTKDQTQSEPIEGEQRETANRAAKCPRLINSGNELAAKSSADVSSLNSDKIPLLQLSMAIRKISSDDLFNPSLVLELEYLNGTAGVDGVHQILQFIINRWK